MKFTFCFLFLIMIGLLPESSNAQMMRPPAFASGIPGRTAMDAIFMQRHQARTLLYQEALAELRLNPQAADLPECFPGISTPCLATHNKTPGLTSAPSQGRRIALLVGNNNYKIPITPLDTPISDVSSIAEVLYTNFGFTSRVIKNASQASLVEELNQLASETRPDDYVLIFYAGHGYLLEDIKMGFWIPVDASVKTAKGWISNNDISKMLAAIPAKQIILISDSCFSGTLTKEQKILDIPSLKKDEGKQERTVVVFSSGADEPVSDEGKDGHSIFAWNLINTLKTLQKVTSGLQIWKTVRKEVQKEYPQEPQYGALISAGHTGQGDYLFQPE